ncbi:hypothetical protein DFJ43DRAFT_1155998 [Lentinula guzmanii]|uniref:Uncharacterized protein n=1 Tax=Lentinula guzmanii TaxID=2804957 RepID=A0AA38JDM4_9AGAR|nr:hypothetical protein DFJ43DRAFT_1155998 [Lentinula guzmanii]
MLSSSSPRRIYAACFLLVIALLSITVTASPVAQDDVDIYVARELRGRKDYLSTRELYASNQRFSVFVGNIQGFRVSAEPGPLKIERIEVPRLPAGGLNTSVLQFFGKARINTAPQELQQTLQTLGDITQLQLTSDGAITDDLVYVDAVMRYLRLDNETWEVLYKKLKKSREDHGR